VPKRKPRKPAGTTGHLPWGTPELPFRRLDIPQDAREREHFVLEMLFADKHHGGPNLYDLFDIRTVPTQNPERNDFPDFFLPVSGPQNRYLEVTEFAPLSGLGTYDQIPHTFQRGGLADRAAAAVLAKWEHYREGARGAALLMYTADWRLHLDEPTVELFRRTLARREHGFSIVIYYALLDDIGGELYLIAPAVTANADFDEEAVRKSVAVRADLTSS
jgi:hypothetical protein